MPPLSFEKNMDLNIIHMSAARLENTGRRLMLYVCFRLNGYKLKQVMFKVSCDLVNPSLLLQWQGIYLK